MNKDEEYVILFYCLQNIMNYSDVKTVVSFLSTSKKFYELNDDNKLWTYLYERDFPKNFSFSSLCTVPLDLDTKPIKQQYIIKYSDKLLKKYGSFFFEENSYDGHIFNIGEYHKTEMLKKLNQELDNNIHPNDDSSTIFFKRLCYSIIPLTKHMFKIYFNYNRLPTQIGVFYNIERLHLTHNFLDEIPDSLYNLTNLRLLFLGNNRLKKLPLGIYKLEKLKELHLECNQMESLPIDLVELPNLKALFAYNNRLKCFTNFDDLNRLEENRLNNLQTLNMCDNKLSKFPLDVLKIKNLKNLYLNDNFIPNVPASIVDTKISCLSIGNNMLTNISTEILEKMWYINFDNNHFLFNPEPFIKDGWYYNKNIGARFDYKGYIFYKNNPFESWQNYIFSCATYLLKWKDYYN